MASLQFKDQGLDCRPLLYQSTLQASTLLLVITDYYTLIALLCPCIANALAFSMVTCTLVERHECIAAGLPIISSCAAINALQGL